MMMMNDDDDDDDDDGDYENKPMSDMEVIPLR